MENQPIQPSASEACLNCSQPLVGSFCGNCGQEVKELRRPFFKLMAQVLHSVFELDGRAYRTLYFLATKPAFLSREYFSGRRMRYTPPLRLFLVLSVSFFLMVSFYTAILSLEGALNSNDEVASTVDASSDELDAALITAEDDGLVIEDDGDGLANILLFVDEVTIPFLDEQTNENLRSVMRIQAEENFNSVVDDPVEFARSYLEYITFFILFMMPVLALILRILYFRSGHFYSEHIVLTVHNHSFIIVGLFFASVTGMIEGSSIPYVNTLFGYLGSAIYFWIWIYLYLSLKNYFQQGHVITLLKFLTATVLFGAALSFGMMVFSAILFFLF